MKTKPTTLSLINWSQLSRLFYGNNLAIRSTAIPKRLQEPIKELETFLTEWIEKHISS